MRLKLEVNSLNKNVGNYKIKVRNSTIIEFILIMKENQQNNGGFFTVLVSLQILILGQ